MMLPTNLTLTDSSVAKIALPDEAVFSTSVLDAK
jgi:hypothetical protein